MQTANDAQDPTIQVYGEKSAFSLGAALLLGLMVMAGLCSYDRVRRDALERVTQPTAVGDTRFITPPPPPANSSAAQPVLAKWNGRALVGSERAKVRDARMVRLAMDDSGSFAIYREADLPGKRETKQREVYFLKVAVDDYVECRIKSGD